MKIAVIGTGYVGLVSGVCFAALGHTVTCVDADPGKIAQLSAGIVPIYEPGLGDLMAQSAARLSFSSDLARAVAGADVVLIAVGTPAGEDGAADLSFVRAAAAQIAGALSGYTVVVTKSTVPVGTNAMVRDVIEQAQPEAQFDVASNPEFLREGAAIPDFMEPDRIVVGVETPRAGDVMEDLYAPLVARGFPLLVTDLASAELIKYAANAFLATKVTFINEIAALCEAVGADVTQVSRGMGLDGRIGERFLRAGPGYGGSCFPKDTGALVAMGQAHATPMEITQTVMKTDAGIKARMLDKLRDLCDGDFNGRCVAVLGVTFKPNTDDMRAAPSLTLVPGLLAAGAEVRVVDPEGAREGTALLPGVTWHGDAYGAAQGADLVVILTEWDVFCTLDLARLAGAMARPRMADLRNVYTATQARAAGFEAYDSVGRAADFTR